jgi:hypothetical protein
MICPVVQPTSEASNDLLSHILESDGHSFHRKNEIPMAYHMRYLLIATHAHNCHMRVHFVVEIDDSAACLMLCAWRKQSYPGLVNEVSASELQTMEEDLKKALRDRVTSFVSTNGDSGKYLDGC